MLELSHFQPCSLLHHSIHCIGLSPNCTSRTDQTDSLPSQWSMPRCRLIIIARDVPLSVCCSQSLEEFISVVHDRHTAQCTAGSVHKSGNCGTAATDDVVVLEGRGPIEIPRRARYRSCKSKCANRRVADESIVGDVYLHATSRARTAN